MPCLLTTEFKLYLVKKIPKNTDGVVSGLILTRVSLNGIVHDLVVYCRTDNKGYGRIYLKWYRSKRLCCSRAFTTAIPVKLEPMTKASSSTISMHIYNQGVLWS